MLTAHLEVVPGVSYTLYCKPGSDLLRAQSYNADGTPKRVYEIGAGRSAYIPTEYGILTLTSEGESAWSITPLNASTGSEEGAGSLKGDPGASAYDIAVADGFVGTEEEWLASLEGAPGLSAYQLAQASGYPHSMDMWLESLKGDPGASAYDIAVADGFVGTEEEWLASLEGAPGEAAALDETALDNLLRSVRYPSTPLGSDNAEFSWLQLSSTYARYGNLLAVGIMCRDTESSTMTTEPRYLGVWEQGATEDEWLPMGVSTATASQVVGQKTEWAFDGLKLTGKPIRLCLMMTATQSWEETHRFAARVTPAATDGSQACADGTIYSWLPQMTLTFAAPAASFADADTMQKHLDDTARHTSSDERAKLNTAYNHTQDASVHLSTEQAATLSDALTPAGLFDAETGGMKLGGNTGTSEDSVAVGSQVFATGGRSSAYGFSTFATGQLSAAFGFSTRASATGSTAYGAGAMAHAAGSTALGYGAGNYEDATLLLHTCTFHEDGVNLHLSTSLYLIGQGSSLAETYCEGEAGLGYIVRERTESESGLYVTNIIARGTRKLSEILTDNTDTFEPATTSAVSSEE